MLSLSTREGGINRMIDNLVGQSNARLNRCLTSPEFWSGPSVARRSSSRGAASPWPGSCTCVQATMSALVVLQSSGYAHSQTRSISGRSIGKSGGTIATRNDSERRLPATCDLRWFCDGLPRSRVSPHLIGRARQALRSLTVRRCLPWPFCSLRRSVAKNRRNKPQQPLRAQGRHGQHRS